MKNFLSLLIANNNQTFDSVNDELLLATKSRYTHSGDTLKYATNRNRITYQATGHLFGLSNGTLKVLSKRDMKKNQEAIVIAQVRPVLCDNR